jgi:hypothetical protein
MDISLNVLLVSRRKGTPRVSSRDPPQVSRASPGAPAHRERHVDPLQRRQHAADAMISDLGELHAEFESLAARAPIAGRP